MDDNAQTHHDHDGDIEAVITHFDQPVDVELLSLLLGDDEPTAPVRVRAAKKPVPTTSVEAVVRAERPKSTYNRRPYDKDVCVGYMSVDERRQYNNERQRERRAAIK